MDYVNTHGTSTPVGDVSEVKAMREVFGGRRVPYSSTKGYTGHPVSAAGAIEAIFTLAMLRGGWIAPCVNVDEVDPELSDYPPVLEPESRPLKTRVVELLRLRRDERDPGPRQGTESGTDVAEGAQGLERVLVDLERRPR